MSVKVSIVIPTYNRYTLLLKTISSLKMQTFKDFEVVVSDDGSTDETANIREHNFPFPVKYVSQENQGRSAARNNGITAAEGDIIIFIDDHIILDHRFIEEHYRFHQKYAAEGVEVVRGRVGYIKDETDLPAKALKSIDLKTYKAPFNENSPFYTFITNNISVTKKVLRLVGGFDPDFKEYGFQDQELGYRIRLRGFKFKINPNAIGYILSAKTPTAKRLDKQRQAGRSAVLFYRKHPWGGLQIGVNPLNVLLYKLLARKDEELLKKYLAALERYEGKDQKKFDRYFNKARYIYFLKGLVEGFVKYPARTFQPRSGSNIVMLFSHQADLSGAPISLAILANHLADYGYYPIFVLPKFGPLINKLNKEKMLIINFKNRPKFLSAWLTVYRYRPTIIHANTFLCGYALKIAKIFKINSVIHVREDLSVYPGIAQKLYQDAKRVIVISKSMLDYFSENKKIDVVYNALEKLPLPDNLNKNEKPYTLIYIGTIESRKGLWPLVKALKILVRIKKDMQLIVLGKPLPSEKAYAKRIEVFIRKNGLAGNIKFCGVVPDPAKFIDQAEIAVVPSLAEPFGRVVIEAMARKKIVIGSAVGGIPEIIDDEKTGFLIKPNSPEELAEAVKRVWKMATDKKNLLREQAYNGVRQRFMTGEYVRGVLQVYNKL
jgi:glycosyltransferase involved in cell wall biosynthesis